MAGPLGRSVIGSCSSRPLPRPWPTTSPVSIASVLVVAFPGGVGTASLVQQARRMASRSPADQKRMSLDTTCWVIEHLRGQAAYRQQQAKRLADLARSDASRADALEESLIFVLNQLQPTATRFSFPNHELSSRRSSAVVIVDKQALDCEWVTVTTTSKPNKAAINEALKAGRQITGAKLLSRRSWRIH